MNKRKFKPGKNKIEPEKKLKIIVEYQIWVIAAIEKKIKKFIKHANNNKFELSEGDNFTFCVKK